MQIIAGIITFAIVAVIIYFATKKYNDQFSSGNGTGGTDKEKQETKPGDNQEKPQEDEETDEKHP